LISNNKFSFGSISQVVWFRLRIWVYIILTTVVSSLLTVFPFSICFFRFYLSILLRPIYFSSSYGCINLILEFSLQWFLKNYCKLFYFMDKSFIFNQSCTKLIILYLILVLLLIVEFWKYELVLSQKKR